MARPKGIPFTEEQKAKLKGRTPWNKGKKGVYSKETLAKMAKAKWGTEGPWRGKKRPEITGENSALWKGGINPINHTIRNSMEYKQWREEVFCRDDFTCQICKLKSVKGVKAVLNANHIKKFADYPEERFNVDNGITLCVDCHRHITGYEEEHEELFTFILNEEKLAFRHATNSAIKMVELVGISSGTELEGLQTLIRGWREFFLKEWADHKDPRKEPPF